MNKRQNGMNLNTVRLFISVEFDIIITTVTPFWNKSDSKIPYYSIFLMYITV